MIEPEWTTPSGCQPAISCEIRSGPLIRLTDFCFDLTYGGLLEGRPGPGINEELVSRLDSWAGKMFNEATLHRPRRGGARRTWRGWC